MSETNLDNVPSTNQTVKTTQISCQTLPNQQYKQVLASFSSPQSRNSDSLNTYQISDTNNIYAITNQIQQRSIDTQSKQYTFLNDDAIVEEFEKLDIPSLSNQIYSRSYSNKSDFESTLKRNGSPSSISSQFNNQNQQQRIQYLERELAIQKQNNADIFYNLSNSHEIAKTLPNNKMSLQEQLHKSNEINNQLLFKMQSILKENELLKFQLSTQNEKLLKQQSLLNGPILRQTQIREEVRQEIEDKLNKKHKEEMNAVITKFSREKHMMIKTIELQKLRILDNERIMLQMEGDLDGIRESYGTLLSEQKQQNKLLEQIEVKNSFEIPEEQTLNKSDQSDRIIESAKSQPAESSISSVQKLSSKLFSPQVQSKAFFNKIQQKFHRKNKSYENHNQVQSVKNYLSQSNINNNNFNNYNQGVYQNTSNTNLPSSQASSGRNHHQRFSSISTPQSIPGSDLYRVTNQFDFYSPEKPFLLNSKKQKSSSNSKQLSQSQTTNVSSKSISKLLNQSSNQQPIIHVKRASLNNGIQIHEPKVGNQFQNFTKNQQQQLQQQQYCTPYPIQQNNNLAIPQVQFQLATTLTPLSEQLSLRSSYNTLQKSNNGLIPPDNELNEALNISNKKSSIKKLNSNLLTPQSQQNSSRVQNVSHINPAHLQGDNHSVMSSQSSPLVYNVDSVNIFNRFKKSIDQMSQI